MVWLAGWLRRLAEWLAPTPVPTPPAPPPPPPSPLVASAAILCAAQDTHWPDRSGESKRHQVYAALLKQYPDVSKRALSRAIEDGLDEP